MKRWQICANKNIKLIKVDCSENAKRVRIINEMWEKFANTGKCFDISCKFCPFNESVLCGYVEVYRRKTFKERKRILNEEVGAMSMKEVTEWDNNPREMWVWDNYGEGKIKSFVVYISKNKDNRYPVITETQGRFSHCAEIGDEEEPKRMTNKELARWLCEKPDREYKIGNAPDAIVRSFRPYKLDVENEPVPDEVYIREGDGPWFVPSKEA